MSLRTSLSRMGIACLPMLLIAGCDRQSPPSGQANSATADTAPATTTPANAAPATDAPANAAAASPDEAAPSPDEAGATTPPVATGLIDRSHKGASAPAAAFVDPAGRPVTLAAFRGKPVLVNLWATWCAPCIAEMPTLDALAKANTVRVVAVSQDLQPARVAPFFAARHFAALQPYTDAKLGLSLALAVSLPTTILYDATGHELWRTTGGFDWASAKAAALVRES